MAMNAGFLLVVEYPMRTDRLHFGDRHLRNISYDTRGQGRDGLF